MKNAQNLAGFSLALVAGLKILCLTQQPGRRCTIVPFSNRDSPDIRVPSFQLSESLPFFETVKL